MSYFCVPFRADPTIREARTGYASRSLRILLKITDSHAELIIAFSKKISIEKLLQLLFRPDVEKQLKYDNKD